MLHGCAKHNQTRAFKKIFSLIIFVIFFENLHTDMLLKLILNLFSRRKRFKCAKNTFKLFIRFDLVFIRHLTTRQGSSVKNRPLIIFVNYLTC